MPVSFQSKTNELERELAFARGRQAGDVGFVPSLLRSIEELFDKELFSDIRLLIGEKVIYAHRLVLAARGRWSEHHLSTISELRLEEVSYKVAWAMLRWVYTDKLDQGDMNVALLLQLLMAAAQYELAALITICEQQLMSHVNISNCLEILTVADQVGAVALKQVAYLVVLPRRTSCCLCHLGCSLTPRNFLCLCYMVFSLLLFYLCFLSLTSPLIAAKFAINIVMDRWDDLDPQTFESLSARLLYEMIKQKSNFPLHRAILHGREDVVFLYLIEHDLDLGQHINELDERGCSPLDVALKGQHQSIAITLVCTGTHNNYLPNSG